MIMMLIEIPNNADVFTIRTCKQVIMQGGTGQVALIQVTLTASSSIVWSKTMRGIQSGRRRASAVS